MPSVKFHLYEPYIRGTKPNKLKSTKCSIYLRFTLDRENRFPMLLNERIEPKYWDFNNQKVRGTHPRHLEINLYLKKVETDIQNKYYENRELAFDKFKALVLEKKESEKKTLFQALDKFIESYRVEKDSKTLAKYLTLKRQLETFDKEYPIDFKNLDFNFYDKFKAFLLRIPNPFYRKFSLHPDPVNSGQYNMVPGDSGEPVGIFDDNVYKYIQQIKAFLTWAGKRGYEVNSSYKAWEVIRRVHPPISLTSKELEILENTPLNSKALEVARDYLVFECRTGQRISDIKRFDLKDLKDDKWTFTPRKGNRLSSRTITVHFKGYCAPALEILHRYNWKMPVISEQKLNDNIKKACKAAGITSELSIFRWAANKRIKISGLKYEYISSHCGRRTFITLGLQAGIPVEYIMALTGITEYKTIRHYKGEFEDSMIEKYLEGIQESKSIMKAAK